MSSSRWSGANLNRGRQARKRRLISSTEGWHDLGPNVDSFHATNREIFLAPKYVGRESTMQMHEMVGQVMAEEGFQWALTPPQSLAYLGEP